MTGYLARRYDQDGNPDGPAVPLQAGDALPRTVRELLDRRRVSAAAHPAVAGRGYPTEVVEVEVHFADGTSIAYRPQA